MYALASGVSTRPPTAGLDEKQAPKYIREQEQLESGQGSLDLKYYLTPWFIISPDLQVLTHTGGDKDDPSTIIGGVRIRVIF